VLNEEDCVIDLINLEALYGFKLCEAYVTIRHGGQVVVQSNFSEGIQGFRDQLAVGKGQLAKRIQRFKDSKIQRFKDLKIQGFEDSRISWQ